MWLLCQRPKSKPVGETLHGDAFNWAAVDRFEIVAEYHDLAGMQFWFDSLRVTDPVGVR